MIATLTPACVYEVFPDGARWEGHAGATRFYTELLGAFPDIHFDLTDHDGLDALQRYDLARLIAPAADQVDVEAVET